MSDHPPILIIVINWQQPLITVECINSLQRMDYPNKRFLLIDNGSEDNSSEYFQSTIPRIPLIAMPENLGFAKGANVGLRYALQKGFEHALLINNDAFPKKDMLTRLHREIRPDIALLSPKIYYKSEPDRIWFAGGERHPTLLEVRNRGQGEMDGPQWQTSRDVDYLLGTCLLVNLPLVAKLSFFDERYFMYYEDLDLSLRCQLAGLRLRLVSDAHLHHRVSVSSGGEDAPARVYMIAKSSILFFHTHASIGNRHAILVFRAFSAVKRLISFLAIGNHKAASAYLRGLLDGWHTVKSRQAHDHNAKSI